MTNTKNTKRALIASVLSIVLCFAMLIGSTFAWFTDSATTGVNTITAGNLDIDLVDAKGISVAEQTLNFVTDDNRTDNILWEPGCTYKLPELFVKNNGNLWLKYQILISGIEGDAKLNEVIDWTILLDGQELTDNMTLAPNTKTGALTVEGHMHETAGNEYQNLTITGIQLKVVATQLNSEEDSYGSDYDEFAGYESKMIKANGSGRLYSAFSLSSSRDSIYVSSKSVTEDVYADFLVKRTAATNTSYTYDISLTDSNGNNITLLKDNEVTLYIPAVKENVTVTKNGTDVEGVAYVKSSGQLRFKTSDFGTFVVNWENLTPQEENAYLFTQGKTNTLSYDMTQTSYIRVTANKNYTFDATLTYTGSSTSYPGAMNFYGTATTTPTITLNGNGGITATNSYAIHVGTSSRPATVVINGGNYIASLTAVNVQKGTVTINGGFFQSTSNDGRYLLNCIDSSYTSGTAKIIVKGGTFVNFDPSNCAAEGEGTNFVAAGYKVVAETQANGDTWYTVVAE